MKQSRIFVSPLRLLLSEVEANSATQHEKGTVFERIVREYLMRDPMRSGQYESVKFYADWARERGKSAKDLGIDLVAKLADCDGYAAIQCKFYDEDAVIDKAAIDSFVSASGGTEFQQRIVVDTTLKSWSGNAEAMLGDQAIESFRIGLNDLEASPIDWRKFITHGEARLSSKKTPRPDQEDAISAVIKGLEQDDRGKMIMACGTGKTFTSLKIAERMVGAGGMVLFMVPSLSLIAQTVREWSSDSEVALYSLAVCSDSQVGKRRKSTHDVAELEVTDLAFPASTNAIKLSRVIQRAPAQAMRVVFATYQSIQVIRKAQQLHDLGQFDLIICDEAHRTTGQSIGDEDDSAFVQIHSNDNVAGKKRLYMTATPRIYSEGAKKKADEHSIELCSMDNRELYGEVLFHRGFSWAVDQGLLTDFKVIVLGVDEDEISHAVQKRLSDEGNELKLDDATKIIGCYKALRKLDLDDPVDPGRPMRRALAFCGNIAKSRMVTAEFSQVVEEYLQSNLATKEIREKPITCALEHVDGTFRAKERNQLLNWLKEDADQQECRILSNARCLSEGVDVPALDAIIFMHPRKSHIDVVQSVGRVMRRARGKKMGYVILPIAVPSDVSPEEAMRSNEKFKVVWQILNALRAHDDRMDATINQASLGQDISQMIEIVYGNELESITATVDSLADKKKDQSGGSGIGGRTPPDDTAGGTKPPIPPVHPSLFVDEFSKAILAQIVKKCGTKDYWEDWAKDIQVIAENHLTRLKASLEAPDQAAKREFEAFVADLQENLNASITEDDAMEMLSQHLITQPVFAALFDGSQFVANNQVSQSMQRMLHVLQANSLDKETESLQKFYASVKRRALGINDPQAKQKLIVQLYDKFFRGAFPRVAERLGIVYTPVSVVDFILRSVNDVLQDQFGHSIGDRNIHVIDPFTGTGTFITRLMQLGLMTPRQLRYKYKHEIHANEIVLLAYYIAAINIETTYHTLAGENDYVPFDGLCLTDTFQMYENDTLETRLMPDNSARRKRQKALDIRVIIGNPPYSTGQGNANDNNANLAYPKLDGDIADSYTTKSKATNKNALYDSYIRAIRWGSDRLGNAGVLAFVTGSAWLERSFADGMRQCLVNEYSSLYIFHLRGDIRKNMLSRGKAGEGENVFGQGSMTGVAISLLVKDPHAKQQGQIYFHDIGDDLDRGQKLEIIRQFASINGIAQQDGWQQITPNQHHDWLNQRQDNDFDQLMPLGDKKNKQVVRLFANHSQGVKTNRDTWCYNFSRTALEHNIRRLIDFYNQELERWQASDKSMPIKDFVTYDATKIKWTGSLLQLFKREKRLSFEDGYVMRSLYRPFIKQWFYFSRYLNERVYQMPQIFPHPEAENRVIITTGVGSRSGFDCLMSDCVPSLDVLEKSQCFPLYLYERKDKKTGGMGSLFVDNGDAEYRRKDGITDEALQHFQTHYQDSRITKEAMFYYVYEVLHDADYREKYKDNLSRELARIPCLGNAAQFWRMSEAGKTRGEAHIGYETADPYPLGGIPDTTTAENLQQYYRISKMKFAKRKGQSEDRSTLVINNHITLTNIPESAFAYQVGGRSPVEWAIDRLQSKTDKDSGITNAPIADPENITLLARLCNITEDGQRWTPFVGQSGSEIKL